MYKSLLWKCVKAFAVETAGTFDRDYELKLWTNLGGPESKMKCIEQDLRSGQMDLMGLQRFLSDKILGMDRKPSLVQDPKPQADSGNGFLSWCGNDNRQVDAGEAERRFREETPLLQGSEHVEFAFKGRRDMVLLTTKRVIEIDVKGWSGKKQEFRSLPWSSVIAFAVRSAGSWLDKDAEMMLWTEIAYDPGDDEEDDPDKPGMAYIELDFKKDAVDLMAVQRYLAMRCLPLAGLPTDVPVPDSVRQESPQGAVEGILNWLGDNNSQLDADSVQAQLEQGMVLLPKEAVAMAFKAGRDQLIFTNRRILTLDVQVFFWSFSKSLLPRPGCGGGTVG